MRKRPVVFIASQQYTGLGIGYLAASLAEEGYDTLIIDVENRKENILKEIKKIDPVLAGFSVIYQYNINVYIELIRFLRKSGIRTHFTAGGNYASLRFEELMKLIPGIDSVVRFDGEYPIKELVRCLDSNIEWRQIRNVAWRDRSEIIPGTLRPVEKDLDKFPFPFRPDPLEYAFGMKYAAVISGRGCIHNCAFCNEREFNRRSSGPAKRIRNPRRVAEEIEYLYKRKGCSVIIFEDDDFPAAASGWAERFCQELKKRKLTGKVIWKINCRPDEVSEDLFMMMRDSGLFMVFLGIEDGTDSGLKWLNKNMNVQQTMQGLSILRKLGIGFDYGFILFQPGTTFRSLRKNLNFLAKISVDGFNPVKFLTLVPTYETRVEKELIAQGRLKGKPGFYYYDFIGKPMNRYHKFINSAFGTWLRDPGGLVNVSKWANNYFAVWSCFFGDDPEIEKLRDKFRQAILDGNIFILDTLTETSFLFESGEMRSSGGITAIDYRERINRSHEFYQSQVLDIMRLMHSRARELRLIS